MIGLGITVGVCGGGGAAPPPAYSPSLDYSDARNSQYFYLLFVW